MLRDLTRVTMSAKETEDVNKKLSEIGFLFNQIGASTLKTLENNRDLAQTIETFNNTFVRKGEQIKDTAKHVNALIKWVTARYQKEIDKRKTEKGKNAQMIKRDEFLKFFSQKNKENLKKIFDLQKLIIVVKLKLINILNKLKSIDTFVKTPNGFKVTGEEGYVAIDKLGGDAVKIVDRLEFSYNNFSPDILKGWDKPGR
jgi:Asp-tRNA(Asn)/Glu-tRNA(Gln) amidotransferase C subunit